MTHRYYIILKANVNKLDDYDKLTLQVQKVFQFLLRRKGLLNVKNVKFSFGTINDDYVRGIFRIKCEYLYGCNQYGINPGIIEKGKLGDIVWFDEGRIEITGKGVKPESVKVKKPGAEDSHPNIN